MRSDATFVPLHTKSDRSAGYGTASVAELVRGAVALGCGALALNDVENLYAQVELHHAARAAGIKAITGVELRANWGPRALGEKRGRLVLLARARAGYESLCRIVTRRRTGASHTPDPLECLEDDPRGVFFLSDDVAVVRTLLARGVHADDVRFLLARPGEGVQGVKSVANVDAVRLDEHDRDLHRLLVAIRKQVHVRTVPNEERAILDWTRASEVLPEEALSETLAVAEACTLDLCDAPRVVPSFEGDANETLAAACAPIAKHGEAYRARLAHELEVIRALGLAPYFLVAKEITDHARAARISVAGRGSAASSLVCFALGITTLDPIAHELHFERFVHARRADPPDIDLDLPSTRRDEVVDWVFRRFGRDRVAMVCALNTFRRRGAFREGLKALGMRFEDIDRFCARVSDEADEIAVPAPIATLPYHIQPQVPTIERLVGKLQHVSVHPGGVVIADAPLARYAPLERAPKGVLVTQYDLRSIAKLGLLKIDLLGNRALAALDEAGETSAPDGDPATIQMLREGRTIGCFQVETAATRSVLRKVPVSGVRDLAVALALVRPGPSSGDAKAAFVRRVHGEEPSRAPHPALEALLAKTHGMMLFEEDILSAIAILTRCSLDEADSMRAAIVNAEGDPKALAEIEREFRARALPGAEEAWRDLARFAAYSFNRAHATSYAELAWRTTFMKAHHPTKLACGVLNHYGGAYPLRTVAADFARGGVRILRPDVNRSKLAHHVEDGAVRLGLFAIKHLTKKNQRALLDARPFADMRDLLARTALSARELRSLVLCGACDDLAPLNERAYPFAHEDLLAGASLDGFVARAPGGPRGATYRALVRVRNEVEILGMHPSDHPMRVLREEAKNAGALPIDALAKHVGRHVRIAGIVAASRRIEARGGKAMQFVTLEDETGVVEVVLFPGVYAALGDPVTTPGPFLVDGVREDDHGDVTLTVMHVAPFHRRPNPYRPAAKAHP